LLTYCCRRFRRQKFMSIKNPKNLIAVVGVIAALMAGTVLLGGYANSNAADNDAPVKACQGKMAGCPMTAQMASSSQMMAAQADSAGCSKTPCKAECPKPCCFEEGCCENPCPIPCPKPCCAEGGCCSEAEKAGCCPMTAT